ncbi:MAG TPA: Ig-like domain-containing protein [Candidatus Acidoferrum sp.]|nr:Ig-like domain-containing protein [Candidatus Acidoferrum sp.]
MKKLASLLILAGALGLSSIVQAQILVGPTGVGPITFGTTPTLPITEWSTRNGGIAGTGNGTYTDANSVEAGIQTISSTFPNFALPVDNDHGAAAPARHNATAGYLYTQTTGADATVLMATLRNDTPDPLSHITVSYDFGVVTPGASESSPGLVALFSTNGQAGSWVRIPEFTGVNASGPVSATIFLGVWVPSTDIYVIWADDNAASGTDGTFSIDNFAVSNPVITNAIVPLQVTLTAPTNNALFAGPLNVTISANAVGTTPATSVSFYTNGILAATDTSSPFSVSVLMPIGTHTIYAEAANASETATSATRTIEIRDAFMHFVSDPIQENFDSMGTAGTLTPLGWSAGFGEYTASTPNDTLVVSVGNGGAPTPAAAWNYGTTGDPDRALGTAPTGTGSPAGDRSIVVKIKNDSGGSITAIDFFYTGELWRTYTNGQFGFTNQISLDQGQTWINTGTDFNFLQPTPIADPPGSVPPAAVNGNAVENQIGIFPPTFDLSATPVPPNGTIFIRWFDRNEGGTDGAVAIDDFIFSATVQAFTPSVIISSPINGSSHPFGAPLTLTAATVMANPVTNVTFYLDNLSTVIGIDTNAPFTVTASNLTLGSHTLFVTAQDNTGLKITNADTFTITVAANVAPSVTITNPVPPFAEMLVGANVTVGADATDSDGAVLGVEFYVNGVRRGTNDVTIAYSMEIGNLTAGVNLISAVAIDTSGGRGTNSISITVTNPPGVTALVPNGSDWKYWDTGTDPGATWTDFNYNDSAWLTGFAELGFGDANARPEVTTIQGGPDANHFATMYFRKKFNVANPGSIPTLTLRIMKDDHAIVYLNGTKIFSDMTNTIITFQTFEEPAVTGDGAIYEVTNNIPGSLLQAQNILAVEVHQNIASSTDASFDLMLFADSGTSTGPRLTIARTSDTQATISWGADAAGYTLYGGATVPFSLATWNPIGGAITGAGSTVVSTTAVQFFVLRNP